MKQLIKRIKRRIQKSKHWIFSGIGGLVLVAVEESEMLFSLGLLVYVPTLCYLAVRDVRLLLRPKQQNSSTELVYLRSQAIGITKWIGKNKHWFFAGVGGFVLVLFEEFEPFFSISLVCYFAFLFYLAIRDIRSLLRLKHEKSRTELLHLQSQVNPHFFFNMLNNLYGLVEQEPKKAQSVILKLSDMMRYSIYDGQKDWVTLEEEVEYLENHIELHKMRYHKKVHTQLHVELDEEHTKVMPLLFIILLENAFKHGVEKLRSDAFVSVSLISEGKNICFEVENNFDITDESTAGIGLENLRKRLDLVYPRKHELTISVSEDVYRAQLMLMP